MTSRARLLDAALAVVSAVMTLYPVAGYGEDTVTMPGSRWWVVPLLLVPAAALLWRRTSPLLMVAGVWVPFALHAALTGVAGEGLYLLWPAWVSLYSLAAYGTRRQLLTGIPLALLCLAVHDLHYPLIWQSAVSAWDALWWDVVAFLPALVGGIVAGSRRTRALAADKALAEAEARVAVAEERARIARELHDVVTHNLNLVVLQAMAADGQAGRDQPVRENLRVIERSGREALTEMRRLLGVLRDEDGERPLAPQPGMDDVGRLVGSARTAGLSVDLDVSGAPRPLPAGLALTIYRIVQEALTNAARHAAGSRVGVRLAYEPDAVDVAVVDDGGHPADSAPGGGRGLVGMRERVAAYAGTLEAGPAADGGFAVRARLPLPAEEP